MNFNRIHNSNMLRLIRIQSHCKVHYATTKLIFTFKTTRSYNNLTRCLVSNNNSNKLVNDLKYQKCNLRTTQPLYIPPFFAVLVRPLVRIGALLIGRRIRKWWAKKTPEEKDKWLRENKNTFLGSLGFYLMFILMFYVTHLETDPLTNKVRFIIFNEKQQAALSEITFQEHLEMNKNNILDTSHPIYKRLSKIVARILNGNKELLSVNQQKWTLTVINHPLKNAYVLPGGHIFVFTGALQIVENDDQLGFVLAHEISHVLLNHSYEAISREVLYNMIFAIPLILLWAAFPDMTALFIQLMGNVFFDVTYDLPKTRATENEADDFGLQLAAKACMDVRDAVVFWGIMDLLTKLNIEPAEMPWLSTHPSHKERAERLEQKMQSALKLREDTGCPRLNKSDPITAFSKRTESENVNLLRKRGIAI